MNVSPVYKLLLFLSIALITLTQSACISGYTSVSDISYHAEQSYPVEERENMMAIDLRATDENENENENENKRIVDVLLDNVKDYPKICNSDDFIFETEVAEYVLLSAQYNNTSSEHYFTAQYRLKDNSVGTDSVVSLTFCSTKEDCHKIIKNFLDGYSMDEVYASYLEVGDLALGGSNRVDFVRGNVYISVEGLHDLEIDTLAKEIDQQILKIISDQ